MAPGADLVLAETLLNRAKRLGVAAELHALLVGAPDDILAAWVRRSSELGRPPSEESRLAVEERLERLIQLATNTERVDQPGDVSPLQYQRLAARLCLESDELVCVLWGGSELKPGGSAEVARWRRHPEAIPSALHGAMEAKPNASLVIIDPENGQLQEEGHDVQNHRFLEVDIRDHLAAGNALGANDQAMRALESHNNSEAIRYLYLRSLAEVGGTRLALRRFEELAPLPEDRSEDWHALPARLHKDLAFAGIRSSENLRLAADAYELAYARCGGAYSAVNAATLHVMLGDHETAQRFAENALSVLPPEPPAEERDRYFWFATRAEACLIEKRISEASVALARADPLLRDDLTTRSRTRGQIGRLCIALQLDEEMVSTIAMPAAYVIQGLDKLSGSPKIDPEIAELINGAPCFVAQPDTPVGLNALFGLINCGARLHIVLADSEGRETSYWGERFGSVEQAQWQNLLGRAERVSSMSGFLPVESAWRKRHALRLRDGLAMLCASSLGIEMCGLRANPKAGQAPSWSVCRVRMPPQMLPAADRRMVGLVFTDMVDFSRLSDSEVQVYWSEIVPRLAECIKAGGKRVLLRNTWGDALHIVTSDAQSAAKISLRLIQAARDIRKDYSGRLGNLQIRVGAHFAPAYAGYDTVSAQPSFYGTQLSFAARVEPVTPPDTVFVTEAFAAELKLEVGELFRLEYAGEIQLAKRYGSFRLFRVAESEVWAPPIKVQQ
ncbi:MAG: tetratricopeptide repeat-containing protein [Oceanococcus sp.]